MKRRTRRLLTYGGGACVLAVLPSVISLGWTYVATVEQARGTVDELARHVADNVHEVLSTTAGVLLDVARDAQQGCTDSLISELRTKAAALYATRDIGYVTADGYLACNSYGRLDPPRAVGTARTIEPEGTDFILTPPVATVFTPGRSIIIAHPIGTGDFVNILVPPELLLSPLRPGILGPGGSVEVTLRDSPLAVLGRPPADSEQYFRAREDVGIFGVVVTVTADRVAALAEWRRLALVTGGIGGIVGVAIMTVGIRLAMRRPSLGDELGEALDQREFVVHYQPIIDLRENRCIGAEALIRWQHPARGLVRPDLFIGLAEETGAIVPMTRWLMGRACEEIGELLRADQEFHVAINLAPVHLLDLQVVSDTRAIARIANVLPCQIMFEITERGLVDDSFCREVVQGLADLGSSVAIDDFGTGYSNLAYIGMFRLHFLKIDKAFVKTIGSDAASAGLAQVIVDMARTIGLKVIAEGVETGEQATFLRERGVHLAQGWYYSRPLPGPEFVSFARNFAREPQFGVKAAENMGKTADVRE